jgi:hypothetical protein
MTVATLVAMTAGLFSADCTACDNVGCFDEVVIVIRSRSGAPFDASAGTKYLFSFTASDGVSAQVACDARIPVSCGTSLTLAEPVDITITGEQADGATALIAFDVVIEGAMGELPPISPFTVSVSKQVSTNPPQSLGTQTISPSYQDQPICESTCHHASEQMQLP